ncbi:nucleolar GTP-binding protein [Halovenus aranensis]|uniref:Nucleolar GTP-binding protein n=1 Tax=Halovenus aranensis TaxID=890420 RepID=A0A1G8TNL0_9EURY|nr:GTPase [Halovenus aranensis]SDJ43141.1 nucleolar GTP-binding protein [Halovenus aranensis]
MSQPFEGLPTSPLADELVDQAFSRAARAGRAKSGHDAQESMLLTATNIISDNLENVVSGWPDFDRLHPFYVNLADAIVDVDALRQHLNEVTWASRKATDIRHEYESKMRNSDVDLAKKHRKQAFARLADVVEEVEDDLEALLDAREQLRDLPDIRPDEPTIVVAGYPNVGKSSFVNDVTRASNKEASYPFTTTQVHVGHVEHRHIRYQLVDTPGLLDRPADERNEVESQAVSALEHAADAVLVVLDPSVDCGYPLDVQRSLRDDIEAQFDVPVLSVFNKRDRVEGEVFEDADQMMSVRDDDNVEGVLMAAIEAVDYEPELPIDEE